MTDHLKQVERRNICRDVHRRHVVDRPALVMRLDGDAECLGHCRNPLQFTKSARPSEIGIHDRRTTGL